MKYTIKKGRHFANFTINRLFPFSSKIDKGTVKFSKECLAIAPISGRNKLTGIAGFDNHKNSGRLVWQSDGNMIKIWGYVYKDGIRTEKFITSLEVEKEYSYEVSFSMDRWFFYIDGNVAHIDGNLGFWKFKQYVYFGGLSPAPLTMSIWK